MGLNARQQKFVETYAACGNASEAARQAGYKTRPNVAGPRLLANAGIAAAIAELGKKRRRAAILTLNQRHELLSSIATNTKAKHTDRIRAVEVLMRANGEFASVAVVTPPAGGAAAPLPGDDDDAPTVTFYMPANGRDQDR